MGCGPGISRRCRRSLLFDGGEDAYALDGSLGHAERIFVKNDEAGKLAGLDGAFGFSLEGLVGGVEPHGAPLLLTW